MCSSHFASPSATVGPVASRSTTSSTASSSSAVGTARWIAPHSAASAPATHARAAAARAPARSPTRRGSNQVAPLSGVKPRSRTAPRTGRRRRRRRSRPRARGGTRCPPPTPDRAHDRRLDRRSRSGIKRCACDGRRRWMLPTRGRAPRSALRATMSKPQQKCSPAPSSRMTRTASSCSASVDRRRSGRVHHRVGDRVALLGPIEREPEHARVRVDARGPATDS